MENNDFDARQDLQQPQAAPQEQQPVSRERRAPNPQGANAANRRPASSRRRRRSKMQIFKETYLPMILLALGVIIIIVVIVTLSSNSKKRKNEELKESVIAAQSEEAYRLQLKKEADTLIKKAEALASSFDYDAAIATLDSFSDDKYFYEFDLLVEKRKEYEEAKKSLVAWDDPSKVITLSTRHLIADPARSFAHDDSLGNKYNYITVNEFSAILEELYKNGYILVSTDDIIVQEDGTYKAKTLYLPEGKKPIILIQNHDSRDVVYDGDRNDKKDCTAGFSSRLLVDDLGNITSEYISRKNETLTGNYDFVPILESFIQVHPDFSYRGARAILAVTGYNYLFGYEVSAITEELYGEEYYNSQVAEAKKVAEKLKELGYEIASYTYGYIGYGSTKRDFTEIQNDVDNWMLEVAPIVGQPTILVYPFESDIAAAGESYSGSKYELLKNAGFSYFIGVCDKANPWVLMDGSYVRQGTITIDGNKIKTDPGLYTGIFDAVAVKDEAR